jgi:LysR family hydrogen peroxide-inducible transcriptional activator
MTLSQLEYIVAVFVYGSFSEAANRCFVTQPTLSMQIQKLEDELGIIIFDRAKQPIRTTEKGERIIRQAKIILQESERLKNEVETETRRFSGRLRIGIIPTVAPYLLPKFLTKFIKKYPDVELIIDETTTHDIVSSINKDKIDLGILALPINDPGIIEESLYFEPFVGFVPRNHALFEKDELSVDDISVDDLLLLKEGHCLRDQTLKLCKSSHKEFEGKKTKILFEGGNLETLIKLVKQGFGLTLLPYLAIDYLAERESIQLVREFCPPVPKREVGFVHSKTHYKKHLIKILREEILFIIPETLKEKEENLIIH